MRLGVAVSALISVTFIYLAFKTTTHKYYLIETNNAVFSDIFLRYLRPASVQAP
jgi:hypothetical protein